MTLDETTQNGVAIFRLAGELDLKEAPNVEAKLGARATGEKPRAVVNLERLEYIDSAGLRALLKSGKAFSAKGGTLVLVAPSPAVRHVLEITRTLSQFRVAASEAEALATLGP